uniref:Putative secreted peptide n=1 Tax=Anopheles braziliensis TaxID=58242 RepID=A0A2M3ZRY9_9DIPT
MYAAPLNAPKRVLCWLIGWLNVKFALSPGMVLGQQSDCVCVSLNGSTALYHYRSLSLSLFRLFLSSSLFTVPTATTFLSTCTRDADKYARTGRMSLKTGRMGGVI